MIPLLVIFVMQISCSTSFVDTEDPDLAVIIGGTNGSFTFVEVEIYRYVGNSYHNCSDNTPPRIPDFPAEVYGASAGYVKDIGIYVCGGGMVECYKYNPRQNKR